MTLMYVRWYSIAFYYFIYCHNISYNIILYQHMLGVIGYIVISSITSYRVSYYKHMVYHSWTYDIFYIISHNITLLYLISHNNISCYSTWYQNISYHIILNDTVVQYIMIHYDLILRYTMMLYCTVSYDSTPYIHMECNHIVLYVIKIILHYRISYYNKCPITYHYVTS